MITQETTACVHVPAGKDRFKQDQLRIWGLIPLSVKVSTQDSAGGVFIFEHSKMAKGGPPRHVHFEQDEWFYALKGEFVIEIGDETHRLRPGDSIFAPRMVPHAWACVSSEPGSLLTLLNPAGTFEAFILETTEHRSLPSPLEVEKAFERHGMKVLGPPLEVA